MVSKQLNVVRELVNEGLQSASAVYEQGVKKMLSQKIQRKPIRHSEETDYLICFLIGYLNQQLPEDSQLFKMSDVLKKKFNI